MPILNIQLAGQDPSGNQIPALVALQQRGPVVQVSVSVEQNIAQQLLAQGIALPPPETGFALVDTGATLTVLPRKVADALRLMPKAKSKAMTAGGPIMIELSDAEVEIGGKTGVVRVAISDTVDRVLIGVTTLETLGLTVDPISGDLKESAYLLY